MNELVKVRAGSQDGESVSKSHNAHNDDDTTDTRTITPFSTIESS